MNSTGKTTADSATAYFEKKIGKTLYRVTCVYKGEIDFAKAIEDLTIRKILRDENTSPAMYKDA